MSKCPHCGYCKECGRANLTPYQPYYPPYYPWVGYPNTAGRPPTTTWRINQTGGTGTSYLA